MDHQKSFNGHLCTAITALAVTGLSHHKYFSGREILVTTDLLLDLETIDDWRKLTEDLVCLLVELKLCRNQIRKVAERLWGIKDLIHQFR